MAATPTTEYSCFYNLEDKLFIISTDTNSDWETTAKGISNSLNLSEDTPNITMNYIWIISVYGNILDLREKKSKNPLGEVSPAGN